MRPSQPRRRVSVLQGGHRRVQPLRWWQGATGYGGHVPAGTLTLCAATAATGLQKPAGLSAERKHGPQGIAAAEGRSQVRKLIAGLPFIGVHGYRSVELDLISCMALATLSALPGVEGRIAAQLG